MNDDERQTDSLRDYGPAAGEASGGARRFAPADVTWERAVADARRGDGAGLVAYIAHRADYDEALVDRLLHEEADEPAAILCRAAGLPWDSLETILSYRSRRYGRGPGSFGLAIRLYRDTRREAARALVARLAGADAGMDEGSTPARGPVAPHAD